MVSIKQLIKIISTINLKQVKILKDKLKVGSTKIRCPNINKIKKLGFKSKISLKDGISRIF